MRNKFDEQLHQLNKEMMKMANMIQIAIQDAVIAFFKQDIQKAKQIMEEDSQIDQQQKKIESICFQLLIQQQPVSKDLRNITSAMKMVTDMERIGDQAADISELTIKVADIPYPLNENNIKKMSFETIEMLMEAIEAFIHKDINKAKEVIKRDDIVDDLFLKVKSELIEVMQTKPDYAEHVADLLMVNEYLERIGDHTTNIAEWVIFSIDKHIKNESL